MKIRILSDDMHHFIVSKHALANAMTAEHDAVILSFNLSFATKMERIAMTKNTQGRPSFSVALNFSKQTLPV